MKGRIRSATCLATVGISILLGACQNETPIVDYEVVGVDEGGFPVLDPPFTTEETTAQRTDFDWGESTELLELDDEGRPAFYYAIVLVDSQEQRDLLELARIHYDTLPLFPEEFQAWEAAGSGTIEIAGDDHGVFVFTLLPGAVYNEIRRTALDGSPPFEVVRLRDVPDPAALHPEGYLDFDVLVERGCTFGLDDEELEGEREDLPEGVGASEAPLFGRIIRAIVRIGRGIANATRRLIASVRLKRDFSFRMRVVNADEDFQGTTPIVPGTPVLDGQVLRQAWGADRGRPIIPHGAKIDVRTNMGLTVRKLSQTGEVAMRIPRDKSFSVLLRLRNDAATITVGSVFEKVVLLARGNFGESDRSRPVHVARDILDRGVHELSLLTDARDFAVRQLGHHPRRALVVDLPGRHSPSAVGCYGSFGVGTTAFGQGRGWSLIASFWSGVFSLKWDMMMRGDDGMSRGVAVHEYGHFLMCDMIKDVSRRDFGRAYGEVIQNTVDYRGEIVPEAQARMIAEGWADFYAAQVVGYTNYFTTSGARESRIVGGYCDDSRFDPTLPCTEDNVGGPAGSFPQRISRDFGVKDPIARFATLMVDAFDGTTVDAAALNAGVRWTFDASGATPVLGAGLGDEVVHLGGRDLRRIVSSWSKGSNHLHFDPFYSAVAQVLLERFDELEVCQVFALHDPVGDCKALASAFDKGAAPPFRFEATTNLNPATTSPVVEGQWTLLDPEATEVQVEVVIGTDVVESARLPYAPWAAWSSSSDLPFDELVVLRVASIDADGDQSAFASRTVRTPPEPVRALTATPSVWSVQLSWPAAQATSYRVRVTNQATHETSWDDTEGSPTTVSGLQQDVPYAFEVYSVDAFGQLSTVPSPTAFATPVGIGAG